MDKKLTKEDREQWINDVMLKTGMHTWWKQASSEEKQKVYIKRHASQLGIPLNEYTKEIPFSKKSYYIVVEFYTEKTYFSNKELIDPDGLRGNGYHLDHKYSVSRGYHDCIPPEIIGSIINLEIIPASENMKKSAKCSINKETLLEKYYGQFQ